jgi:hypothetical protein
MKKSIFSSHLCPSFFFFVFLWIWGSCALCSLLMLLVWCRFADLGKYCLFSSRSACLHFVLLTRCVIWSRRQVLGSLVCIFSCSIFLSRLLGFFRCSVISSAHASRSVTDSRFSLAVRCLPPGFGPLARFWCRCSPDARSLLRSPDCCCCSGQVSRSLVFGFAGQLLLISVSALLGFESAAPEFCFQHRNSVGFASVLLSSASWVPSWPCRQWCSCSSFQLSPTQIRFAEASTWLCDSRFFRWSWSCP